MTTNDKPVCYQCRVLFPCGTWSDWFDHESEDSRDRHAEHFKRIGNEYETRDLYDRPQPAAPQVPEHPALLLGDLRAAAAGMVGAIDEALSATPPAPQAAHDGAFGWWVQDCNGVGLFVRNPSPEYLEKYRNTPGYKATPLYALTPPAPEQPAGVFGWWVQDCNGVGHFARDPSPEYLDDYRAAPGYSVKALYDSAPPSPEQPKPAGDVEAVAENMLEWAQEAKKEWKSRHHTTWMIGGDAPHPDVFVFEAIARRLAAQPAQGEGEK